MLAYGNKHGFASEVEADWAAVDEIPFDFERRRLSVVLQDLAGGSTKRILVCKVCIKAPHLFCFGLQPERLCLTFPRSAMHTQFTTVCMHLRRAQLFLLVGCLLQWHHKLKSQSSVFTPVSCRLRYIYRVL